jgi:transcriptional regulator with XRE-family HTH domain
MRRETRPSGNVVGPQVRRLRYASGLSQPALAAACQRLGWDVGRDIIARIETQVRLVTDAEVLYLAAALKSSVDAIYPKDALKKLRK